MFTLSQCLTVLVSVKTFEGNFTGRLFAQRPQGPVPNSSCWIDVPSRDKFSQNAI